MGRILSRREVLAALGMAGVGMLATRVSGHASDARVGSTSWHAGALHVPACVVRPEQTEGPYFVDERINRGDIRADPTTGAVKEGLPLELELRVFRVGPGACEPLPGAMVDVWQCDALGVYSDVRDMNARFDTSGQKFLRGYQLTDASGSARFTSVYPGWYEGRTVHIHFKIRTDAAASRGREFTSQLYFDDAVTDRVLARAPYASKGTNGRIRNERDGIYRRQGGPQLMLALTERDAGYQGTFDIGLDLR
ncbi:MAG TPA: intradiol ring-cleavage dioxygenase [Gemmatimonadaceae bacterium]|nr:intradiol ring-cleavage dioxygenase [Gemmatimonadaceae bacterium]